MAYDANLRDKKLGNVFFSRAIIVSVLISMASFEGFWICLRIPFKGTSRLAQLVISNRPFNLLRCVTNLVETASCRFPWASVWLFPHA